MSNIEFLETLESVIRDRVRQGSDESYTARLAASGTRRIAQKVGEEGVEVALAAVDGDTEEIVEESADLLYHLLVLLNDADIRLAEVVRTLVLRHGA